MSAKKKNFRQHSPLSSPTHPPVARDRNKTLGKTRRYLPEKNKPSRQKLSTITPQKKERDRTETTPFRGETEEAAEANRTQLTTNQLAPTNKKNRQPPTRKPLAPHQHLICVSLASHLRLTSVSFAPTILGATPHKSRRRLLPKYRLTHPAPRTPARDASSTQNNAPIPTRKHKPQQTKKSTIPSNTHSSLQQPLTTKSKP